jgi:hypothetical protein
MSSVKENTSHVTSIFLVYIVAAATLLQSFNQLLTYSKLLFNINNPSIMILQTQ